MRLLIAALLGWSALAWGWSDADEQRYQNWTRELRCLVCQNQTIADSHAPLAADLREQVHKMIESGSSDVEIERYMTDRYGDFVLYRPPFKPLTWALWLGPFALLLTAIGVALGMRRKSREAPAEVVDPDAVQRILDRRS